MNGSRPIARPHILLVNPWIHDFAAYDVWAKPLGLLTLGAILRAHGCRVGFIDCLDRFHPRATPADPRARGGRGPFLKTPLPTPTPLAHIRRTYSRYGIPVAWLREDLARLPRPDAVLVTSLMTYWYPGVQETIHELKTAFPGVPVALGGVYATLCPEHARRRSGADLVIEGEAEGRIVELVKALVPAELRFGTAPHFDPEDMDTWPRPALDLQRVMGYLPLQTSRGCPFDCAYCASRRLNPSRRRRSPQRVLAEIVHWHQATGVRDLALYDDAFLVDPERHARPILKGIADLNLGLRLHTPNALHIRAITAELAALMFRAGFHTLRLGLETAAFEARGALDAKVTADEFTACVDHLRRAGFRREQLGAYLLAGLPDQTPEALKASIDVVHKAGITPIPAYYSPIPGTRLWDAAVAASPYDLEGDPLFCNNAILPCVPEGFSWEYVARIRSWVKGRRSKPNSADGDKSER
ncbi:MAG: cobalamin-dependent protein [Desulfosarcinaceae bacterium]